MANKDLENISSKMRNLDICMMTTRTSRGILSSRPMSNNGQVEYDGNSYFFTFDKSRVVSDLDEDSQVNLAFNGPDNLYISVIGKGKIIKTKAKLTEHWIDELKQWFPKGIDTPGIAMIHVKASRIKYWQKEEEGEVKF